MKIIEISPMFKTENNWSCLPCAFALALGIPVKKIIEKIGHDGSEILYPNEKDPFGRKSFHIQELIDIAFDLGMFVIGVDAVPCSQTKDYEPHIYREGSVDRLLGYLQENKGVLTGTTEGNQRHAVCWDGEKIIDPNGYTYGADKFGIENFWIIGQKV